MALGILILVSITVITLDYRGAAHGGISDLKRIAHDVFSPIQSAVQSTVRPIGSILSGSIHAGALEQQNAKLRAEIGRLQRQQLSSRYVQSELLTLQKLNSVPWSNDIAEIDAEVVALNSSNFADTIQLNVGTSKGVAAGMPVIGGAGLVGQVADVWSSGCSVRLITDTGSAIGVVYGNPPNFALLQGAGSDRSLSVAYIAPGTHLTKGEVLTTSGLQGALFPPGVPVARVESFSATASSTEESVTAKPLADLSGLQYVAIMQWLPQP